jgi:dihydroorotase-like cyclic amidohydrolase
VPQIKIGERANLTLADTSSKWKLSGVTSYSKSANTPFADTELTGKCLAVINNGRIFSK